MEFVVFMISLRHDFRIVLLFLGFVLSDLHVFETLAPGGPCLEGWTQGSEGNGGLLLCDVGVVSGNIFAVTGGGVWAGLGVDSICDTKYRLFQARK